MRRRLPAAKAMSYGLLGLFGAGIRLWSPAEAVVICSVAFAADGLLTSLLPQVRRVGGVSPRVVGFLVPLGSLLIGRGLAAFLGLT